MNVTFRIEGLEELKAQLRNLPADLTGEAGHVIEGHANAAGVTLRSAYGRHRRSGNLQDHVKVEKRVQGRFGVAYKVASTASHAWLFDNGSQVRHWASGKSTGAMWGKTPPTHVFVRTLVATRRAMWNDLRGVLERAGLTVTGEP